MVIHPIQFLRFGFICLLLLNACNSETKDVSVDDQMINVTNTIAPIPSGEIEHLSGGDTSVSPLGTLAFSKSSRNLITPKLRLKFGNGNHFFENPWVAGNQSTRGRDGLGPYFNSNACQNCHIKDGRGHAGSAVPDTDDVSHDFASLLIRVSKSNITVAQQEAIDASMLVNVADSTFGRQLQHKAIQYIKNKSTGEQQLVKVVNEVELAVSYTSKIVTFNDGFEVKLRSPIWHMTSNFESFDTDSVFSARVSPQMIGLGLLELIDEQDIINQEDTRDSNQDGISGRANIVWSLVTESTALGRFGWKAGQASLLEQSAGAFAGDMGLTSKLHPEENCFSDREDCLNAPSGISTATDEDPDQPDHLYEVNDKTLSDIVFYTHHLAVPRRRNAYAEHIQFGKLLFMQLGCESCHVQRYTTGEHPDFPELSNQAIFPYTDMLLHNMGKDLADFNEESQPIDPCAVKHDLETAVLVEFQANACEWRTPPLWGLGLSQKVDQGATFLHDGRAETILEAILWHGGEAQKSRNAVLNLTAEERDALLAFLNDL